MQNNQQGNRLHLNFGFNNNQNTSGACTTMQSLVYANLIQLRYGGERLQAGARGQDVWSITGSSTSPTYHVKLTQYSDTDRLEGHEIKPISNESKKRKTDGSPVTPTTPTLLPLRASSQLQRTSAQSKWQQFNAMTKTKKKNSNRPPKPTKIPRKVKAYKKLETNKNRWQQFNTMTKGKAR
ncbi:uncharacterized protein K452DRAFT_312450 [Aplosporella prunicola CBS 121167]|uniref:Uncharacterized protein n=1 Tax=Aplosporella prunicola CBS 121167 TaxID=1176127 RepID=A0A6A6B2N9_9PEZI|nr:uncharacterized protein K452DRAFT_312450 [Aplosporella prunicola CBS 121167]KAF2137277.1 hypothetical protein K452DRAFT_312450 [Aplosporella prunicola CBS 121167]